MYLKVFQVNKFETPQHFFRIRYSALNISFGRTLDSKTGPVFIQHLKSNVYVTLNAIGLFQCNLCSHWLIQFFYLSFFMNMGPENQGFKPYWERPIFTMTYDTRQSA